MTIQVAKKKWLRLAFQAGVTLLLLILLFRLFSWSAVFESLTRVRYGLLLVALVVGVGGVVLSAYQWRSLLQTERIRFDLADLINLHMVGIAFNHFLPTIIGGDAVKALYVGRTSANTAGSISAVLMCRITGFVGMLLVAVPVLVIVRVQFSANFILAFIVLCLLTGIAISCVILASVLLPESVKKKWACHALLFKLIRLSNTLSASVIQPRSNGAAIGYSIVFWGVAILNCYSYAMAIGMNVPLYFFCVAVPLIALISSLPISINGWGIREHAFVFVFSTIHIPAANALLLALFLDAQALLFGIIGGCIYLKINGQPGMVLAGGQQKHSGAN